MATVKLRVQGMSCMGCVKSVKGVLEAIIIAAAIFKRTNGDHNMQANIWGKIKMNLQVLGVVILLISILFNVELLHPVSQGTFYLPIAFAILSLFTYSI